MGFGLLEMFAGIIASQVVIAIISTARHKVHIDYLRADVEAAKESARRAHQRIDEHHHQWHRGGYKCGKE